MKKLLGIATFALCTLALAAPSQAQHSRGGAPASRGRVAAPRGSVGGGPRVIAPYSGYYRGGYYPYYGGFYGGYYPFYSPYYSPWGFYGAWGYPYGYGFYPYGGYYDNDVARGVGGVRIVDAPKDAQVYADGYYAGTVDDFDSAFQHLTLEAGAHTVEIREQGRPPISFQVNIVPGETITYHAR